MTRWRLYSVYGSKLIARAMHRIFNESNLIDRTYVEPKNFSALLAFFVEALGVTVIDLTIKAIRRRFDSK